MVITVIRLEGCTGGAEHARGVADAFNLRSFAGGVGFAGETLAALAIGQAEAETVRFDG